MSNLPDPFVVDTDQPRQADVPVSLQSNMNREFEHVRTVLPTIDFRRPTNYDPVVGLTVDAIGTSRFNALEVKGDTSNFVGTGAPQTLLLDGQVPDGHYRMYHLVSAVTDAGGGAGGIHFGIRYQSADIAFATCDDSMYATKGEGICSAGIFLPEGAQLFIKDPGGMLAVATDIMVVARLWQDIPIGEQPPLPVANVTVNGS